MINLEQVRLLEAKVAKTIDYVERLTAENAALSRQETELRKKLEAHQKRIDELEVLIRRFKEDQGQIEETFFAALDRLNKFEGEMEKCLGSAKAKTAAKAAAKTPKTAAQAKAPEEHTAAVNGKICFEIPEASSSNESEPSKEDAPSREGELSLEGESSSDDDITDPLADTFDEDSPDGAAKGEELEIF